MPRVAMIVWNEFTNDARVLNEAKTLQASGYQVTVFALYKNPDSPQTPKLEIRKDGIRVIRIASSPIAVLRSHFSRAGNRKASQSHGGFRGRLHALLRMVSKIPVHIHWLFQIMFSRPHVVHAHDINTLPTAWLAARLTGARLVYDAHEISTSREGYASVRTLVALLESWLAPRANAVITTTAMRATFMARAWHIQRPLVLQNRPRRSKSVPVSESIREALGLACPWPIVLYQGGLQQGRGLHQFVETALSVPNAYFVLIGSGRLATALQEHIDTLQLGKQVFIIPTVPLEALARFSASADIGVQPILNTCFNHYSTDSNKLFEYIQAHLPVVASNLPEIRKIMVRYETGICVPPDDTKALSDAIATLVNDSALRERYRANARTASRFLCWETQEHKLETLYQTLIQKHESGHHAQKEAHRTA